MTALRRIIADLTRMADEPETITPEALRIAATRLTAQAEMAEQGLWEEDV